MKQPNSNKNVLAVFRCGDISSVIWTPKSGGPLMTTIRKNVAPHILAASPELAHTFTSQDVSALRKLMKETEDALFNFQSLLIRQVEPHTDQAPPQEEQAETTEDK